MKHLIGIMLIGILLCTVGCCAPNYEGGEEPKMGDRVKYYDVGTVVYVSEDKRFIKVKYGQTEEELEIEEHATCYTLLISRAGAEPKDEPKEPKPAEPKPAEPKPAEPKAPKAPKAEPKAPKAEPKAEEDGINSHRKSQRLTPPAWRVMPARNK